MKPETRLQQATERYTQARAERDAAMRDAASAGMTLRAIASVVGLSHQRVAQIVQAQS